MAFSSTSSFLRTFYRYGGAISPLQIFSTSLVAYSAYVGLSLRLGLQNLCHVLLPSDSHVETESDSLIFLILQFIYLFRVGRRYNGTQACNEQVYPQYFPLIGSWLSFMQPLVFMLLMSETIVRSSSSTKSCLNVRYFAPS